MAIELTPPLEQALEELLTDPGLKMPDLVERVPPTAPMLATIRELELDSSGALIDTRYSASNHEVDLGDVGGLATLLVRLQNDDLDLDDDPVQKTPHKSPLSVKNFKYSYLIFKLTGKNWQFSRDKDPFSIGLPGLKKKLYFQARRVDDQGATVSPGDVKDDCKIAYFISDGAKATSGTPRRYSDDFNFHLDLIYYDSAGARQHMPIVIDPDVRYPGGSGLDGGP